MISLIAAVAQNNAIGINNHLPWHLPDDLKFFKEKTLNKPIVMGRKTFEAFGKPLPHRQNIVMTSATNYLLPPDCHLAHSINEIKQLAEQNDETMIIGGEAIYRLFLPHADRMYLTHIDGAFEADTFFPDFERNDWKVTWQAFHPIDSEHKYSFTFMQYDR